MTSPLEHFSLEPVWEGQQLLAKGGSSTIANRMVQEALATLHFVVRPDGFFKTRTFNAIKVFQASRGILIDGVVGPETLNALSKALSEPDPEILQIPLGKGDLLPEDNFPGYLAFTFSEGPSPRTASSPSGDATGSALIFLERAKIKASFYLSADQISQNQDIIEEISSHGHIIGIQGSQNFSAEELERTRNLIIPIVGDRIFNIRPNKNTDENTKIVKDFGTNLRFWQLNSTDKKCDSQPELIIERLKYTLKNYGGSILFHDAISEGIFALPGVLDLARQLKLKIVTDEQLLSLNHG